MVGKLDGAATARDRGLARAARLSITQHSGITLNVVSPGVTGGADAGDRSGRALFHAGKCDMAVDPKCAGQTAGAKQTRDSRAVVILYENEETDG
jgi:hypothetical protein